MMKNFRELFKENDFILKFHQPVKIIAELKYMVFFIIGEIYRNYNSNYQIKIIYYSFFIAILILAIIKGSKVIFGLFIILYFFSNRKKIYINLKNSISSFLKNMRQIYRNSFFYIVRF